jgi:hypothetical protein
LLAAFRGGTLALEGDSSSQRRSSGKDRLI